MSILREANLTSYLINQAKLGTTDVKQIYKYNPDGTQELLFPAPPSCIRAELSIDKGQLIPEATPTDQGGVYGHPVLDVSAANSFTMQVTTYPNGAPWYIETVGFTMTGEGSSKLHFGDELVTITFPARPEASGTDNILHKIIIKTPVTTIVPVQQEVVVPFWTAVKGAGGGSSSAILPTLHWTCDDATMTDVSGTHTLVPVDTGTIVVKESGVRGNYVSCNTAGALRAAVPFDATHGATVSAFVKGKGTGTAKIGFNDYQKGVNDGNHLWVGFSYYQPQCAMPIKGYQPKPATTTADRWANDGKFHHLCATITEITDFTTYPGVTYDSTTDTYTYTSPTFGSACTRTYYANKEVNAGDSVAHNHFYMFKFYADGVLKSEMPFPERNTVYGTATSMMNTLGLGSFDVSLIDANVDGVDDIMVCNYPLTEAEIKSECAAAGIEVGGTTSPTVEKRPVTKLSRPNKPTSITTVAMQPVLTTWVLDNQTIAVAGDYMDWFRSRLLTEFGDDLPNIEWNYRNAGEADYVRNWYYRYGLWTLYGDYHPVIRDRFDSPTHFTVKDSTNAVIATTIAGRWLNSNREVIMPDLLDGTEMVRAIMVANIINYSYLRLATPMVEGQTYTVTDADGNSASFIYDRTNPCPSIKVNQSGYRPARAKKPASLGMWIGTGNALIPNITEATQFEVVPVGSTTPSFTGPITKLTVPDTFNNGTDVYKLTGEEVWRMDFGSLVTEGEYQIHIPGVGWSYPFVIGARGIGKQFFMSMWGMYHQRSGIAKVAPYTKWESPVAGQPWTFESKFASLNGYGQNAYGNQTVSDSGASYSSVYPSNPHFSMIRNNLTGKIFRDIRGGWMDAADYDKRGFHLICSDFMVYSYLYAPANFTDNQLVIPESGNGIPDILSEAEWGLDVWRRSQYPNGGVGTWIESTQHEAGAPWTSDVPYCLAQPCLHGSLQYAFSAARLAKALSKTKTNLAKIKATLYTDSAIRAFLFGVDPNNACSFEFNQDGVHWTHNESVAESKIYIFRAAAALYTLTGDDRFKAYLTLENFNYMQECWSKGYEAMSYFSPELLEELAEEFPAFHAEHRKRILDKVAIFMEAQKEHAYSWLFWSPTAKPHYVKGGYCGWGSAHPGTRGWMYLAAAKLFAGMEAHTEPTVTMGDYLFPTSTDILEKLEQALDWSMGHNPMGRVMTSGVGTVYPVWYLCSWLPVNQIPSKDANGKMIEENLPGITPYQYSNSIGYGLSQIYCLAMDPKKDVNFPGLCVSIFPNSLTGANTNNVNDAKTTYQFFVPIQHQYHEVGGSTVGASEYTVWETMAPLAALAGALMGTGFTPDPTWKTREPIRDRYAIPGYIFLP